MAGVQPLGPMILVDHEPEEDHTEGGVFIPQSARERTMMGTVIATGEGRKHLKSGKQIPVQVEHGQRVMFGKHIGEEVEVEGKTYLMMHEDDLLAVEDGEEAVR